MALKAFYGTSDFVAAAVKTGLCFSVDRNALTGNSQNDAAYSMEVMSDE
ncbi:MAG: hypothetical protein LBP64_09795 [Tannerella sp.]|jgi:hypothetical protein|nr:hypothetical protein [Tannerella sp.]